MNRTASARTGHSTYFAAMDGLRGVAALVVVAFHSYDGGGLVPNGVMAVDFFFLLSGFVVANAYASKFQAGLSFRDFFLDRTARLYPMIFVGSLLGTAIGVIHNALGHNRSYPAEDIVGQLLTSVLCLPYLVSNPISATVFPLNGPMWSLFFEVFVNIVYFVVASRLTLARLIAIVMIALVICVSDGHLGGAERADFLSGFPRVICGFFGGVLLFELYRRGRLPSMRTDFRVLAVLLIALFALPRFYDGMIYLGYAWCVGIVILATNVRPGGDGRLSKMLGELSYPLYVIHIPIIYVSTYFAARWFGGTAMYRVAVLGNIVICPVVAYLAFKYYETPVRRWMKTSFKASALAS